MAANKLTVHATQHKVSCLGLILLLLALAGCAAAPTTLAPAAEAPAQPRTSSSEAGRAASAPLAAPAPASGASQNTTSSVAIDRMIVRSGDLSLVVADTAKAQSAIADIVGRAGGYVAESTSWRDGEQLRARVGLRVPAEKLDALLVELRGLSVRVEREDIKSQDVTAEFSDLGAQLTNLQATEEELRELLTDIRQRTQKAEDVLAVYRELTQIRGEIERVQGRINYLGNITSLATLKVELIPDVLAKPVIEPGWRPQESVANAGRQLVRTGQGLVEAAAWLIIYIIPVLILVLAPLALLWRGLRWLLRRISGSSSGKPPRPGAPAGGLPAPAAPAADAGGERK